MNVEGLALKEGLTDDELRQAAKELGVSFQEIKLMYQRARQLRGNPYRRGKEMEVALKEKTLKEAVSSLTPSQVDELLDTVDTVMKERNGQGQDETALKMVDSLLRLPDEVQRLALANMTDEQKEQVTAIAKEMLGDHGITVKSQDYSSGVPWLDRLTDEVERQLNQQQPIAPNEDAMTILKEIRDNVAPPDPFTKLAQATRGKTFDEQEEAAVRTQHKQANPGKTVVSVNDAFTSRQLNQGGVHVATKEREQLTEDLDNFLNQFTSKELSEEPDDNRPKTSNDIYDQFTSTRLNQ